MTVPNALRAAAVALAMGAVACSSSSAAPAAQASPAATPSPPRSGEAAGLRLVFFMNPNGAPCQMQDQVLRGMAAELAGKVGVVYVRTTEPAEIPFFERFGIRSLPQLIVVDGSGRELRRATPGIQSADAVRRLVGI